jgi:uncharacterized DUF497 family protein
VRFQCRMASPYDALRSIRGGGDRASWDDHNQAHIARHGVTAAEVSSLIFGPGPLLVVISDEHRVGRREFYGQTESGRYLLAVTEAPTSMGLAYVVTSRPMSDRERRAFEERVKNDG